MVKKSPTGPLANIQSQILRPVRSALNQIVGTEVVNTEELCKVLEDHNTRIDLEPEVRVMPKRANKTPPLQGQNFIVGSMDVKALFPNCKKQKSSENIEKAFKLTNLDFKNVDT